MKKYLSLLMLSFAVFMFNCGSDDGPNLIEFETLEIGDQSPYDPGRGGYVLNDDPEYEAIFGTAASVDFDTETVIAVFLGTVGNDVVSYEITEVLDEVSQITVTITYRVPRVPAGPNSSPYHVIKTRKLSRSINFSTLEIRE